MFKRIYILIGIIFLAGVVTMSMMAASPKPKLIWSDEFDYKGAPDPARWRYDLGDGCPNVCGWGNNELQYYTDANKNVRVEGGNLIIEAHIETQGDRMYTSARLKSAQGSSWKYGYIEIRAKLPQGRGTWPAIWMMPDATSHGWPRGGEIDIMEHVGYNPSMVYGTVHTGKFNHKMNTHPVDSIQVEDVSGSFHTYAINWTEAKIDFFVDGERFHTFQNTGEGLDAWPFDSPFHLILNVAVGGGWGGKRGVDNAIWPQRMEIAYVRVYEPMN